MLLAADSFGPWPAYKPIHTAVLTPLAQPGRTLMDPDDLLLKFLAARTHTARNGEVEEVTSKRPGLREGGARERFTLAATMNP